MLTPCETAPPVPQRAELPIHLQGPGRPQAQAALLKELTGRLNMAFRAQERHLTPHGCVSPV